MLISSLDGIIRFDTFVISKQYLFYVYCVSCHGQLAQALYLHTYNVSRKCFVMGSHTLSLFFSLSLSLAPSFSPPLFLSLTLSIFVFPSFLPFSLYPLFISPFFLSLDLFFSLITTEYDCPFEDLCNFPFFRLMDKETGELLKDYTSHKNTDYKVGGRERGSERERERKRDRERGKKGK